MLTKNDLSQIRTIVKEEIVPVKKGLKRVETKLDETIKFFDWEVTHLKKRTDRVKNHLSLPRLDPLKV